MFGSTYKRSYDIINNIGILITIMKVYNIEIAKKIEVDSGEELTEEFLHTEIHPVRCWGGGGGGGEKRGARGKKN